MKAVAGSDDPTDRKSKSEIQEVARVKVKIGKGKLAGWLKHNQMT